MSTSTITVYEHGLGGTAITVGEAFASENRTITKSDVCRLEAFSKQFGVEPFRFVGPSKLVAQQFVGVIQLGSNAIEILPKIDRISAQGIRKNLISMLAATRKLDTKEIDVAKLSTQNLDLLEIIIRIYCDKFFEQLHKGLVRRYERSDENLKLVKGKVLSSINARLNLGYPERLYCEYDELQEDNPLNRVFKATFRYLLRFSKDRKNQSKLSELIFALDEVSDMPVAQLEWNKISMDRQSSRYELLYSLSKLFLKRESTDVTAGGQAGYSLLFDMNELFEEFIGQKCRALFRAQKVTLQGPKKYLLTDIDSGQGVFMTKPDISIQAANGRKWIIDTKWKMLDPAKDKDGVQQQDIYQMYAYSHNYRCNDVFLVSPYHDSLAAQPGIYRRFMINSLDDSDAQIRVATIRIDDLSTVTAQLRSLLDIDSLAETEV
jgi:5-methylcytosine-specific restriction enzyme subunit McrC